MTHCCLVSFQIHQKPVANLSRCRWNQDEAEGVVEPIIRSDPVRILT